MNVKLMLDTKEYENKPQGDEIGKITNRLEKEQVEISIEDLANLLVKGCTFKPSLLTGRKETDWVQEQLFALDFDENTTINEELNRCTELNILPIFGYTSFSHTENHHKFRLVFCTNEVITDYDIAKQLQLTLMNVFSNCDEKCKNLSRLYFGGRNLIYEGYDKRLDYKGITEKYPIKFTKEVKDKVLQIKNDKCGRNTPEGLKVISNTYNPSGVKTQPSEIKQTIDDDINYNIKALRNRDAIYLKNNINNPHIILENEGEFFDYIKRYDLGKLLEIKFSNSFRCIFHEDNNPSAGIFQNDEGTYIYHCFSCGKSYNIMGIVERLGNFQSSPKAYAFIKEIFNLEIMDTAWQREQKSILRDNRRKIRNGTLEQECPTAYKNIKRNVKYLEELMDLAEDNVCSEKYTDDKGNVVFYASTKYICKQMGMSENSSKEISKKNALFAYHGLINKVDDNDAPEEMLKRSQAINANSNNKYKKHINYYSIPSYTYEFLESVEVQGVKWVKNNYTMTGCSREMFYRTEGKAVTDKIFPQFKQVFDKEKEQVIDRTTKKISNLRTEKIAEYIFDILKIKSYVTEKELIDELSADGDVKTSKKEAEKQLKKSLNEILLSYDLKRIRCNKEIKQAYNVTENGYPFIIVRNI